MLPPRWTGGGGLAVGAGDGYGFARTERKENLHFRGEHHAVLTQADKLLLVERRARAAEHDIRLDVFEIIVAEKQLGAVFLCLDAVFAQGFKILSVAGDHLGALFRKLPDQRQVAGADADKRDGLSLDRIKKCLCRCIHYHSLTCQKIHIHYYYTNKWEKFQQSCNKFSKMV